MLVSRTIGLVAVVASAHGLLATAQQVGTNITEKHPALASQVCTKVTDVLAQVDQVDTEVVKCVTEKSSVVIDANWRQMKAVGTNDTCESNGEWNSTTCSSPNVTVVGRAHAERAQPNAASWQHLTEEAVVESVTTELL